MTNWSKYKLREAADIIAGFAFKSEEFGSSGSIAVKIKDITPPIIDTKNADRVDLSSYIPAKMERYEIRKGDFVVAMTGATIGKVGRHVGDEVLYLNQRVAKIAPFNGFDKQFVYYAVQGPRFLDFILNRVDSNSAQGNISAGSIGEFPFAAPEVKQQKRIAAVLSALDEKIELNQRMNEELEGMAKLLYDYWFVQYDFPMSAAQAAALGKPHLTGQPYRASGGPMTYHETLKREIPQGWNCLKLGDLEPQIVTGKTPPTTDSDNFGGPIPFICIGDVRGNMHIVKTELTLSEKGANLQKNKFIPKGSLCVTCIASPGLVGFATRDSQTNQQLNSIVFSDAANRFFLYFYLSDYFRYSSGAKTGNTFANMNKGDFEAINIVVPERSIRDEYTRRVAPMFSCALNNAEQTQELTTLRDWLLPMLMNGQVVVSEHY